jgi:hypothetical protein
MRGSGIAATPKKTGIPRSKLTKPPVQSHPGRFVDGSVGRLQNFKHDPPPRSVSGEGHLENPILYETVIAKE